MLNYYKCSAEKIEHVSKRENSNWIQIENPTNQEMELLAKELTIPKKFLEDALDSEERSRVEQNLSHEDQPYSILIIECPYETKDELGYKLFETMPIGIMLTKDYVITISKKAMPFINDMLQDRLGDFDRSDKWQFMLKLFLGATNYFLKYLNDIIKETNQLEINLKKSMKNEKLYAFMAIQKSLVFFATALQSNKIIVEQLEEKEILYNQELKLLLKEVRIENRQAVTMTETYSNVISGMSDIFSSVISNNLNLVMKFLASVTIILSIPTIISSAYGMNIKLPIAHYDHAFAVLNSLTVVICAILVVLFWKKKYF